MPFLDLSGFARLALSVCFCLDPRIAYIVTSNRQVILLPNVCLKLIDCSLKIRQCNQATVWSCRTTRIRGTSNNKWHMEALRPCSALQCTWIIWICWIKTDGEVLCGTPNLWSHAHLSYVQLLYIRWTVEKQTAGSTKFWVSCRAKQKLPSEIKTQKLRIAHHLGSDLPCPFGPCSDTIKFSILGLSQLHGNGPKFYVDLLT